jgi:LPS-assembly protein
MYRGQWFRTRGFAHNVDFRGKPTQKSEFNFILYGVNDRGEPRDDGTRGPSQGGYLTTISGRAELPFGFIARGQFNYLSSFTFRQAFTESFYEAIYSEVHSLGHLSKYWSTFAFNIAASRIETFQWPTPQTFPNAAAGDNKLSLRRLPSFEFNSRTRQVSERVLPVWVSWNTSMSFLRRKQIEFETRQFVDRLDLEPRIFTALRWKDIHLVPAFSFRETRYGSSLDEQGKLTGRSFSRTSGEFSADLILPSISRIFDKPPAWMGAKLKHVIEPRASFRYVNGIGTDFHRLIRFDETELLSDTKELDLTITNRLFTKSSHGGVAEILTWELSQRRYFDPTFGGAVVEGRRNVLISSASLTGYAFIGAPRNYSPIISALRTSIYGASIEWRTDYDPVRGYLVNSSLSANGRFSQNYFVSMAHSQVRSVAITSSGEQLSGLSPKANQLSGSFGFGQENRRGWSAGMMMIYDYTRDVMPFNQMQVTYNTDCCGWSVQYRRLGFGIRNENQYRFAFSVANIGAFGTLKRQERMF